MKSICIFLAEGFEEVEALMPLDILRRGGLSVKTVSVANDRTITHGAGIIPVRETEDDVVVAPSVHDFERKDDGAAVVAGAGVTGSCVVLVQRRFLDLNAIDSERSAVRLPRDGAGREIGLDRNGNDR